MLVLLTSVVLGKRYGPQSKSLLPVYTVAFCIVVVLGYYGGQLVYGGWSPQAPKEFQKGARVFKNDCSGCHAHGGNVIDPNLPLRSAPQLAHFQTFSDFIRDPRMPDGSRGVMPAWPPSRISEQETRELYQYIVNVLEKPRRK
jgi:mono/diheme cytochrome c family protein